MDKPQPTPSLAVVASPPAASAETEPCAVCGRRGIDVVHIYELATCGNASCQLAALQLQRDASTAHGREQRRASLGADGGNLQRARMLLVAVVCALAAMIVAPAAFGATLQQIYGDYARDGRLEVRRS